LLREQLTGEGAERRDHAPLPARRNQALARAVRSRVDVGDIRGASRSVVNNGKLIEPDQASLEKLSAKHPTDIDTPAADYELSPPLVLTLEQLTTALSSTPAGGAPGPDGLHPVLLKQLTGPRAGPAWQALQQVILDFCNLVLSGAMPPAIRHLFFGANLIAFRKKDGGLRLIAIGLALRRLVAHATCAATQHQAAELFSPIQLGLGIRSGAEAAVNGVRRFLDSITGDSGIVKLDFANAFNLVSRSSVVSAVSTHLPQLERFTRCAYGTAYFLGLWGATRRSTWTPTLFCCDSGHFSYRTM